MIENPLHQTLKDYKVILGSESPRRKQFFDALGIDFEVRVRTIEETYPPHLRGASVPSFLAELKAAPHLETLQPNEILITSDTVVWHKTTILNKPNDQGEAIAMLQRLSGDWHRVSTAVCFSYLDKQKTVYSTTKVKFAELSKSEIDYYVDRFEPFDKAGAYGIQEWLGFIAIEEIRGSYTNVVGLPTQLVYEELMRITEE